MVKKFTTINKTIKLSDTWRYYENTTIHDALIKLGYGGYTAKENDIETIAVFNPQKDVSMLNPVKEGYINKYQTFNESNSSFGSWFKNSKVVDSNNEPLVVYHQTNEIFNTFDIMRSYTHSFWFTSNLDKINNGETGATNNPSKKVVIMEVYLSIQKMAGWDEYDKYGVGELISMGFDGIKLDDDYVVFEANQIKSINNKSYSQSKNIYR